MRRRLEHLWIGHSKYPSTVWHVLNTCTAPWRRMWYFYGNAVKLRRGWDKQKRSPNVSWMRGKRFVAKGSSWILLALLFSYIYSTWFDSTPLFSTLYSTNLYPSLLEFALFDSLYSLLFYFILLRYQPTRLKTSELFCSLLQDQPNFKSALLHTTILYSSVLFSPLPYFFSFSTCFLLYYPTLLYFLFYSALLYFRNMPTGLKTSWVMLVFTLRSSELLHEKSDFWIRIRWLAVWIARCFVTRWS